MAAKSKEPPRFCVGEPAEVFAVSHGDERSLGLVEVVAVTRLNVTVKGPDNSGGISHFGYQRVGDHWGREKYGRYVLRKVSQRG